MENVAVANQSAVSQEQIERWLVSYIAQLRGIREDRIVATATFDKFGLDSASAATLSGDLMDWLQCDLDPSVVYEHPTIARLASHLSGLLGSGRTEAR